MRARLGIFVGGEDSYELMEMEKSSIAYGFNTQNIVTLLKKKPVSVIIRGGLTRYCVANTALIALYFGVPEVIIDLHHCRATSLDHGNGENLKLRRETLNKGLGWKATRNQRLHILPSRR